MKQYDVDVEFEILHTILDSLREYQDVTHPFNKKCIAYITDKITNLMDPEIPNRNTCDKFFDPMNPPADYMDGAIPANEEIHFTPAGDDYEFYSANIDDIIESPKRSDVML
jgi:hypothetical protein